MAWILPPQKRDEKLKFIHPEGGLKLQSPRMKRVKMSLTSCGFENAPLAQLFTPASFLQERMEVPASRQRADS